MKLLYDRLHKGRQPEKGRLFWKKRWFSICSVHGRFESTCTVCKRGEWINMTAWWGSHILYKFSPKLWIKWANRKNSHYKTFGKNKIG